MEFRKDPKEQPFFVNVLLYGPAKTGKSTGAATAPGLVGYINADLPNSTEFVHERDTQNRIKEVVLPKDPKPVLSEVMRSCYPKQGTGFDTWVLDPVGELHRRLLVHQSRGAVRPSQSTYGDVSREVEDFVRFMCEAPCHFVIVAHEHSTKDDETGGFKTVPWTGTQNPALGQKILGLVDIIAFTGAVAVEVDADDGTKQRELLYVSQLVPTPGRPVGVRGRFNKLITPEVRQTGWRLTDLGRWLEVAGINQQQKEEAKAA